MTEEERAYARVLWNRMQRDLLWDLEDCEKLCEMAGMSEEFNKADDLTFEDCMYRAARKLGLEGQ